MITDNDGYPFTKDPDAPIILFVWIIYCVTVGVCYWSFL
jgi:hypothetical protein